MLLNYSQPLELTKLIKWFDNLLRASLPEFWTLLIEFVVVALALLAVYVVVALLLIYAERKITAFFQARIGPNRAGKWGLLQSPADMIKILLKEIIKISRSDRFLFFAAPFFMIVASFATFAAIPFGQSLHAIDFNIGVLYVIAISSLGIIGVFLAGWSSNNKYSMIGAMRSGAQFVSYELSAGFALMTIVVLSGTMQFSEMIEGQRYCWNIFNGHISSLIAFVIYLISGHAETNRGPFDLPEAESELTAGYHTEYSGMKFALFFMAEYIKVIAVSMIFATLFLGGYYLPFQNVLENFFAGVPWLAWINVVLPYLGPLVLFVKVILMLFVFIWVRATLPRIRYDRLMAFGWKVTFPLALLSVLVTAVAVLLVGG
jgi:NADH-quinone oxidoreductase subunit H